MLKQCVKIYYVIIATALSSCCVHNDSRVPTGFPYGDWLELHFSTIHTCGSYFDNLQNTSKIYDLTIITRKSHCDSIAMLVDSTCSTCNEIDFNKNSIVFVNGYLKQVFRGEFEPRVIINHREKILKVELRAYSKVCNSGMNSDYEDIFFDKLLLVPKLPDHYSFELDLVSPVHSIDF